MSQYTVKSLSAFFGKYVMIQLVDDALMPQPSQDGQRIDLMETPDSVTLGQLFGPYMKENDGKPPSHEIIMGLVNDGTIPLVPAISRPVLFGELEEQSGTLVLSFKISAHGPHTYKMTLCPSDIKHVSWLEQPSLIHQA